MKKIERDFYQISLKLILKNSIGEILLMKALDKDTYAGFYDLPGGRIDEGEFTVPLPDIVRREVCEEIGNVEYTLNPRPVGVGRHLIPADISNLKREIHVLYILYEGTYINGKIIVSKEHTGFGWFDLTKEDPARLLKSGNLEGIWMYLNAK